MFPEQASGTCVLKRRDSIIVLVITPRWCLTTSSLYTICIIVMLPWASYQIHKIAGAHAPGMPGTFSPSPQVSDLGMHHGTCVTHVPWCMPGSLTNGFLWNRRRGKTFPAFPAHARPQFCISGKRPMHWQSLLNNFHRWLSGTSFTWIS